MPSVLRIIDANANRAREALRVMEEAARFLLDNAPMTNALKRLRHEFAQSMMRFDNLEFHRDTPGDVGTDLSTPDETQRACAAEVVIAAGKRLGEALRAIEEYGKTIDASFASRIESHRYLAYELEQRLNCAMAPGVSKQWRLCVLLTRSLCVHHDWLDIATIAIDAGADCLQLREKDIPDSEHLHLAKQLVNLARSRATVIINDRADIALAAGADGVHLGQRDLSCAEVQKLFGRQLLIGVSTSCLIEAKQAHLNGADYCGIGPMFPSTTKHKETIVGPDYLREYQQWNRLPHLAIGGITPDNINSLIECGVQGIAISSAVCAAKDPAAVVKELIYALKPSETITT